MSITAPLARTFGSSNADRQAAAAVGPNLFPQISNVDSVWHTVRASAIIIIPASPMIFRRTSKIRSERLEAAPLASPAAPSLPSLLDEMSRYANLGHAEVSRNSNVAPEKGEIRLPLRSSRVSIPSLPKPFSVRILNCESLILCLLRPKWRSPRWRAKTIESFSTVVSWASSIITSPRSNNTSPRRSYTLSYSENPSFTSPPTNCSLRAVDKPTIPRMPWRVSGMRSAASDVFRRMASARARPPSSPRGLPERSSSRRDAPPGMERMSARTRAPTAPTLLPTRRIVCRRGAVLSKAAIALVERSSRKL
mmetsp:Transcript_10766/g.19640  ORF Transcript_10766/g.19640 Transcript_10766/m.19640 type:complete len:308 (-) Transcript_10766:367-1290(-)